MTDEMPDIRVRSPWPDRLRKVRKVLIYAIIITVGWKTQHLWGPPAKTVGLAFSHRLAAELVPVRQGLARKLAPAAGDASAGYVPASRLNTPVPRPVYRPAAGADLAVRPVGQPLLLDEHKQVSEFEQAKPIMMVGLVFAVFFGIWAYWKGSGRLKTFN